MSLVASSVLSSSVFSDSLDLLLFVDSPPAGNVDLELAVISVDLTTPVFTLCYLQDLYPLLRTSFRLRRLLFLISVTKSGLSIGRTALVNLISWVMRLCLWLRCQLGFFVTGLLTATRSLFLSSRTTRSLLQRLCFNMSLNVWTDWMLVSSSMECALTSVSSWRR